MRYLSPQRLRPVKQTSLQWHVGQQLSKDRPESLFKVQSDASDCWRRRKYSQHFLQHCTVVPLSLTRNEDKQQRNLFGLLAAPWVKGWRQSLNVPSTYQFLARTSCCSCWFVAKSKCRLLRLRTSPFKNPAGIFSSEMSNAKSVGSSGLSCCLKRFAALAMFSGLGSDGHGCSSTRSYRSTSLTIAEAGLNKFSRATCDKE